MNENSARYGAGRQVSIGCDGEDFVVAFHPENYVIFRGSDPNALRKVCRQLRWEIVSDTASASVAERAGVITEQVAAAEEKGSTQ